VVVAWHGPATEQCSDWTFLCRVACSNVITITAPFANARQPSTADCATHDPLDHSHPPGRLSRLGLSRRPLLPLAPPAHGRGGDPGPGGVEHRRSRLAPGQTRLDEHSGASWGGRNARPASSAVQDAVRYAVRDILCELSRLSDRQNSIEATSLKIEGHATLSDEVEAMRVTIAVRTLARKDALRECHLECAGPRFPNCHAHQGAPGGEEPSGSTRANSRALRDPRYESTR
jgi:hypothetical protein